MEISLQKMSSIMIILGSVLFLIAAFSPISRVCPEPSAVRKQEIIRDADLATDLIRPSSTFMYHVQLKLIDNHPC